MKMYAADPSQEICCVTLAIKDLVCMCTYLAVTDGGAVANQCLASAGMRVALTSFSLWIKVSCDYGAVAVLPASVLLSSHAHLLA